MTSKLLADKLSNKLVGWFALALSRSVTSGQTLCGWFCGECYQLKRTSAGLLLYNEQSDLLVEQNGLILIWRGDSLRQKPDWHIPSIDQEEYTDFKFKTLNVKTHPQEVFENSIDLAHFTVVHDFPETRLINGPTFRDHHMVVSHRVSRKDPFSFRNKKIYSSFEVKLHGIGCTYNTIFVEHMNMYVKMMVFVTPLKDGYSKIMIGVALRKKNKWFNQFLVPVLHGVIAKSIVKDFSQDILIWENKRYQSRPLLVHGDGKIIQFRRWCQQFNEVVS